MGNQQSDVKMPYDVFLDVYRLIGMYVPLDAPEAQGVLNWYEEKINKMQQRKEYAEQLQGRQKI